MPEAAELSYERLASIRTAACGLADSGVLFIHERMHVTEIIARIDAGIHLKHERDQARAERAGQQTDQEPSRQNSRPAPPHSRDADVGSGATPHSVRE